MQGLCVRDEEAVQKGRDSTWESWTVPMMIKAVEGGSRELFTSTSGLEQKAIDQLKSCCGFWISSNLLSLVWNLCENQIWRHPRPIHASALPNSREASHQVCEFKEPSGLLGTGEADLYSWPGFWHPHRSWLTFSLEWPPPGGSQGYPRLMWSCKRHRSNRFCRRASLWLFNIIPFSSATKIDPQI